MQEVFLRSLADAISLPSLGVPWPYMDTNVALRLQAWRLVRLGINQKVIAGRMGMKESAFSRWLRQEVQRPATVSALDGLRQYLSDLKEETTRDPGTITEAERERLEAELDATHTEKRIHTIKKKHAKTRAATKGKRLASRG